MAEFRFGARQGNCRLDETTVIFAKGRPKT